MFRHKKPVGGHPIGYLQDKSIRRVPRVQDVKMSTEQENSSSMKIGGNGDGNKNKTNGNRYHW